jgi:hypothetical protein
VNRSEDLVRLLDGENHLGEVETRHRFGEGVFLDEEGEEVCTSGKGGVTRGRIESGGIGEMRKGR